ncbi:MAG: DPP IV N-terminal domain-containing protein [Rubripirellula sp.]
MSPQALEDCKPWSPGIVVGRGNAVCCIICIIVATMIPAWGDSPQAVTKVEETDQSAPKLSLHSLYHPEQKFDYFPEVPETHWIDGAETSLLIRRADQWNEVDLQTLEEQPWPIVNQLTDQLQQLDGVDEKQARAGTMAAVTSMKSADDPILVKINKSLAIVSPQQPARWLSRDANSWQNVTLDPVGRRVAYVNQGNLFVVDVASERSLQLTHDGSETLLNGVLDWTYQEEIYGRGNYQGFWFSPDGMWMAMLRIDISGIEPYTLTSTASERGKGIVARYPKAGDPIPHAELYLWDLRGLNQGIVPPPKQLAKSTPKAPRIITGVWWNTQELNLLFSVSDRKQSWREVFAIKDDATAGMEAKPNLLFREESPTWIEPPAAPAWREDGSLVWRSEVPSGRTRLYHVSPNGMVVTPLTPPDFDVRDFHLQGERLLVTGDAVNGTIEQHAYQVAMQPNAPADLVPITSEAGWHTLQPSPQLKWVVDRFGTPTQPTKLLLRSVDNQTTRLLAETTSKLKTAVIQPQVFRIQTADGASLPAMLIRPPAASEVNPCPVVIEIYGGPSSPVVRKRFAGIRGLYRELLARQGIATLLVDNRSSAGAGLADTWKIHLRVGEQEFADVMSAVSWLQDQPWVNEQKLAIRGWSFGGFLTLYAMTHSDAFTAGIAGGSVTSWKEYDAFYTERYMGLPSENPQGYLETAPVHLADQIQGRVLLIHGESDDNVHPSNTMRMAAALQNAGKEFDLMVYPAAAHGIRDPKQLWHLTLLTHRFLERQLLSE